ncbi:MAG: universal stress protein [Opitutus sp.]
MNTILAAIDYSRISRQVLATAVELARGAGDRVVVMNVVQPPTLVTDVSPLVGEVLQFTAEIERASRIHLRRIQKRLSSRGISVHTICHQGFPVVHILAQAEELGARYIVLGSHGHNAFYDLVAGSTASGVLKRATCPVVVVPAVPAKPKRSRRRSKTRH